MFEALRLLLEGAPNDDQDRLQKPQHLPLRAKEPLRPQLVIDLQLVEESQIQATQRIHEQLVLLQGSVL